MDMIKRSRKFFISITEGKFQTLSRELFLTATDYDWNWRIWGRDVKYFFFLPSITNRSEEINKYLNNVSISPIAITQQHLNAWAETPFDPSKLDTYFSRKIPWLMQSLSTWSIWMIFRIAISSEARTDCYLKRKSMLQWPRSGSIKRGFHHRNVRFLTDFCCRYYCIFTWRDLANYN